MLAYCHFHSFLIFLFIYYISQKSNSENCFRITGYSVEVRSQVQTITRAILPRNQLPSVSNSQRGWSCNQIFDSSTTFLNPLVGTNSLYSKRTVGSFSLASHALRACELARFARVRLLVHALPISLLILRKNRLFCSLDMHAECTFHSKQIWHIEHETRIKDAFLALYFMQASLNKLVSQPF